MQRDAHLLTVLRYVEANPVRAQIVRRARDWVASSLAARVGADEEAAAWLSAWPIDCPGNWEAEVDKPQDEQVLKVIRTSVVRGRPFGSEWWIKRAAKLLGLEHTIRDPWRPKKAAVLRTKCRPWRIWNRDATGPNL